jgi:hypothetical protein
MVAVLKRRKKSNNYPPRFFRFTARLLLAGGTILATGSIAMSIMLLSGSFNQDTVITPVAPSTGISNVTPEIRTTYIVWATIILLACVLGAIVVVNRLNAFIRNTIVRIAKYMHANILTVEITLSTVSWAFTSLLFLLFVPVHVALAFTATFLIITNAFFLIAWALYGRKKYKI